MANKVVLILRWCAIADLCPSYSGFGVKLLRNTGTFPLFLFFSGMSYHSPIVSVAQWMSSLSA